MASRTKAMVDILIDEDFWAQQKAAMVNRMQPVFLELFLTGAAMGAQQRPRTKETPVLPFDLDAINMAAVDIINGYTDTWWGYINETDQKALRRALVQAADNGLGPDFVMKEIEPLFGEARAMRIAVSETTNLMGMGAQATYRMAGFTEWQWQTVKDADVVKDVDPVCQQLQGNVFPMSTPFQRAHPNCLVPGTMVVSPTGIVAASRRGYEGAVVTIETASGYQLTVTPNHPVATAAGWLAACDLYEGIDILRDPREVRGDTWGQMPYDVHRPSRIEKVFETVRQTADMLVSGMPSSPEDFHGDGGHGDIEIEHAHRPLHLWGVPERREAVSEVAFSRIRLAQVLIAQGAQRAFAGRDRARPGGSVRTAREGLALGSGHLLHAHAPSIGHRAQRHASITQPVSDRRPRYAEASAEFQHARASLVGDAQRFHREGAPLPFGGDASLAHHPVDGGRRYAESVKALPREVATDRVANLRVGQFAGHVYNLETESGWYYSQGIATSNCRCWPLPYGEPSEAAFLAEQVNQEEMFLARVPEA